LFCLFFFFVFFFSLRCLFFFFFFFQAEDGIRDTSVTGVQTCALPIYGTPASSRCLRARREEAGVPWAAARSAEDPAGLAGADRAAGAAARTLGQRIAVMD